MVPSFMGFPDRNDPRGPCWPVVNNLDAVFLRAYSLLYHKFENMVIFGPGNQDYKKIIFLIFQQKISKSTMQKLYFYWN